METTDEDMSSDFSSTISSILYTSLSDFALETTDIMDNSTGNATVDCSIRTPAKFPPTVLGFTAAMAFTIAILGAFGNLLTLLAISKCKKLRTSATAFVLNLALAEFLFCVVILPLSGMQYMHLQYNEGRSMLGDKACVFFAATRFTITQAELQTILAIAFTRALAVSFPGAYAHINNNTASTIYIICIWVWSLGIRLPIASGMFGEYIFNPITMECDVAPEYIYNPNTQRCQKKGSPAQFFYLIIEVLIPLPLILILYIVIFVQVRRSSNRVEKQAAKSRRPTLASVTSDLSTNSSLMGDRKGSDGSTGGRKGSLRPMLNRLTSRRRSSNNLLKNRRDFRVARSIFAIYVMVMVCSVPVAFEHVKASIIKAVPNPTKFLLLHVLFWSQFCLNMFVYVIMNKQYRDAYVEFLSQYIPSIGTQKGRLFFWENNSVSADKGYSTGSLLRRKGSRKGSVKDNTSAVVRTPTLPRGNKGLSLIVETRGTSSNEQDIVNNKETERPLHPDEKFSILSEEDIDAERE